MDVPYPTFPIKSLKSNKNTSVEESDVDPEEAEINT